MAVWFCPETSRAPATTLEATRMEAEIVKELFATAKSNAKREFQSAIQNLLQSVWPQENAHLQSSQPQEDAHL